MGTAKSFDSKKTIYLAEFTDRGMEKEYFNHEISMALKYIKPLLLVLGLLYMSFIIPDYFLVKDRDTFMGILLDRLIFLLLIALLYFRIGRLKDFTKLIYWLTAYEFIVSVLFLYVFFNYESPDLLIQAFGIMLIIISINLIPNRWIYMIVVSVFISSAFFILAAFYIEDMELSKLSAAIAYTCIVIALSSISSYRINYYKRTQYLNNLQLIRLSVTDPLTGIYNRLKFDKEIENCVSLPESQKTGMSLILIDFDDFKGINDTYGHLEGDRVILESVRLIKENIRENDIFARWGGEEFVILLPEMSQDSAFKLAERLRDTISKHAFDKVGQVTCSFGVVTCRKDDDTDSFISRADRLLYKAKQAGKDSVVAW